MKKGFLVNLLFIPIIIGCSNNSTQGFENPFPDDEYIKSKIGFNIAADEQITRALSTKEINTVNETYKNKEEYDKYIKKEVIERHERNYIRAFAGEFKHGYDSSNVLNDENITIERAKNKNDDNKYRRKTYSTSSSINDYSYGRINSNKKATTFRYFMGLDTASEPNKKIEETNAKSTKISDRITTVENDKYNKTIDTETSYAKKEGEESEAWDDSIIEEAFNIKQSSYLLDADVNSGARVDGGVEYVVLYKEEKNEYQSESGEKGVYQLKDGRKYRAMNNSIQVTKLKLVEAKEKEESDWYLVSYVRKYTETVITSKEIQPNVQITMLKEPVAISFVEEKHWFYTEENVEILNEKLQDITEEKE